MTKIDPDKTKVHIAGCDLLGNRQGYDVRNEAGDQRSDYTLELTCVYGRVSCTSFDGLNINPS